MTTLTSTDLDRFRARVDAVVHAHPVVVDNQYTRWFATGEASLDDVRHLTVQFSVFSHLFVEAQLRKVINATTLETYRSGKEILLNELGVSFNGRADEEGIATEGTVDGGRFRFGGAHFEWLLRFAAPLGLEFGDIGKRRHATPATLLLLRRAAPHLRLRRPVGRRGGELRGRALGRRRVLEGAHRRPAPVPGARAARADPRVLDVARQGRGPARRPHERRARRGVRAAVVRRGPVPLGGGRDARRRQGVLGRALGRPQQGKDEPVTSS